MEKIFYERIDIQQINLIKNLWEKLREHHKEKTEYFAERFDHLTFEIRKNVLSQKANKGLLIIDIAKISENEIVAYCVSSFDDKGDGEIDSLFVLEEFRRNKIGDELMKRALKWFDENKIETRRIVVAQGNEEAFAFYQKFGFYHLYNTLQQKK